VTTEERDDANCNGFLEHSHTNIFDRQITDMDAHSYQKRRKEIKKVLEQHEKEKKDKYIHLEQFENAEGLQGDIISV
jgi:hypothetical protein